MMRPELQFPRHLGMGSLSYHEWFAPKEEKMDPFTIHTDAIAAAIFRKVMALLEAEFTEEAKPRVFDKGAEPPSDVDTIQVRDCDGDTWSLAEDGHSKWWETALDYAPLTEVLPDVPAEPVARVWQRWFDVPQGTTITDAYGFEWIRNSSANHAAFGPFTEVLN